MNSNSVCLLQRYSRYSRAGRGTVFHQSSSAFPQDSTREAGPVAISANKHLSTSALGEVSSEQLVWSVATMDAIPYILFVLLFWTKQETTGKYICIIYLGK